MTSEVQLSNSELQRLTSRYGSESARRTEDVGDEIDQIFRTLEFHLSRDESDQRQQTIDECIRCLRNVVAGVSRNQIKVGEKILGEENSLTDYIQNKITKVQSDPKENELLSLRLSLQLLANLLVGQVETQRLFLNNSLPLVQGTLSVVTDEKTINTAAMIIHILLTSEELSDVDKNFPASMSTFIVPLSGCYGLSQDCVWVEKCLEQLFKSDCYLRHLTPEERVSVTSILPFPPEESVLTLLVSDFTFLTDVHLLITGRVGSVSAALQARHVVALTDLLAKCSGLEAVRQRLQANRSLLINTISLLKLVHQAAKTEEDLRVLGKLR